MGIIATGQIPDRGDHRNHGRAVQESSQLALMGDRDRRLQAFFGLSL